MVVLCYVEWWCQRTCACTGAREVARDLHSPLWKTGCLSHLLGQNIFVEIRVEYLSTSAILSKSQFGLRRAGHIAKAYGVMREGSGYRCDIFCLKTNIIFMPSSSTLVPCSWVVFDRIPMSPFLSSSAFAPCSSSTQRGWSWLGRSALAWITSSLSWLLSSSLFVSQACVYFGHE